MRSFMRAAFLIGESERFRYDSQLVMAELDLERLTLERMRQNSFGQSMQRHREELRRFRKIPFNLDPPKTGRSVVQREESTVSLCSSGPGGARPPLL